MTATPYNNITVGHATMTFMESEAPIEFNRWFEDDHQYACKAAPWTLSSGRWIATQELKGLRYPQENPVVSPAHLGTFLCAFLIREGRIEENEAWRRENLPEFQGPGRTFDIKQGLLGGDFDFLGSVAPEEGIAPLHSLDHGFSGLVCLWVRKNPDDTMQELFSVLEGQILPEIVEHTPIELTMVFTARPKPDWFPPAAPDPLGLGEWVTILAFTRVPPQTVWSQGLNNLERYFPQSSRAELLFAAPFLPVLPGTDQHLITP